MPPRAHHRHLQPRLRSLSTTTACRTAATRRQNGTPQQHQIAPNAARRSPLRRSVAPHCCRRKSNPHTNSCKLRPCRPRSSLRRLLRLRHILRRRCLRDTARTLIPPRDRTPLPNHQIAIRCSTRIRQPTRPHPRPLPNLLLGYDNPQNPPKAAPLRRPLHRPPRTDPPRPSLHANPRQRLHPRLHAQQPY